MQALHDHIAKDGFRLRGTAMSRIDGFSDVVFGFALTLLVVSLEVPHTYAEFHTVLLGFFPFAICFYLFMNIWYAHFKFFRRYHLHDAGTLWLNCTLLFTVLVYVYPLKFLFAIATAQQVGSEVFTSPYQLRELTVVYGAGFAAIYLTFTALYVNAWRQRAHLQLNPIERSLTLASLWLYVGIAGCGILCCLLAFLLPLHDAARATYSFLLILPWGRLHAFIAAKRLTRARAHTTPDERGPLPHAS